MNSKTAFKKEYELTKKEAFLKHTIYPESAGKKITKRRKLRLKKLK